MTSLAPGAGLAGPVFCFGFSRRKRAILRSFLAGIDIRFVRHGRGVPPGATLLLWGSAPVPDGVPGGVRVVRVEDGFIRSVGLGVELVRPLSWVFDAQGIYYDATRPSDLEHLLQTAAFDDALRARARALRERLVAAGVTKYNVDGGAWRRPAGDKRVILVPGQVETDASIRFGAPAVRTNLGLLQAVREANPDAHVVYKIHPDVLAGLRARGEGEEDASRWCDQVVADVGMNGMLDAVDEVHTLTSLAGFEALLRGRAVTCYGQPFYSGWGLTTDMVPISRRTRRLTLDELVAGALILYPLYTDRTGDGPIPVETAVDDLLAWRMEVPARPDPARLLWRMLLRTVGWLEGRR